MPSSASEKDLSISILTHRGLEPGNSAFNYTESSREAFHEHLSRGYGIEFDVVFTGDLEPFIWHDIDLARASEKPESRCFQELSANEVRAAAPQLLTLSEILSLIRMVPVPSVKALHLKGREQTYNKFDVLSGILQGFEDLHDQLLIFDLTIEAASLLRKTLPRIHLAPSVAHPFDVERFNTCVSGTLYTLPSVLRHRDIFDWVWLDEWDCLDAKGGRKVFYTEDTVNTAKREGFSVALVSPELHAASPALLGGEAHEDGVSVEAITSCSRTLISIGADAICTDYPELYRQMIQGSSASSR